MTRIKLGEPAPNFTIDSINFGKVTTNNLRGQKTLIVFSRYFGCPVCQLEFDELREFLKGHPSLKLIYINQSLRESAVEFIKDKDVSFPVIASPRVDGKDKLYELYGVGSLSPTSAIEILLKGRRARKLGKKHGHYEGVETQSPAQFLIDENGIIIFANYGLFDADELKKALSY